MRFTLLLKSLAIAFSAGVLAWLPLAITWAFEMDGLSGLPAALAALPFALMGSICVGLPVAVLTFLFAGRHLASSPTTLAMVATLAGIMMVLTSYAIAEEAGVVTLGIPAFIAALTYGILGWFWIIKPIRRAEG
ncbi:MAG: hypothetical protein AAFN48_07875 [Pseudomonadota bacterium]